VAKPAKPPYTSVSDVDAFFDRIGSIAEPKPPKKVDTAWVQSYDFETAHPSAIPAMLRWLGVIDQDGQSTGVWNKLRVERHATLEPLVKKAYKDIFEVDVAKASDRDLRGAFISAYEIGESKRHIACFLALCAQGGIQTAQAVNGEEPRQATQTGRAKKRTRSGGRSSNGSKLPTPPTPPMNREIGRSGGMSITLNVEIPVDWNEDQIRERIATVSRAAIRHEG
jgi:hypothetical protein